MNRHSRCGGDFKQSLGLGDSFSSPSHCRGRRSKGPFDVYSSVPGQCRHRRRRRHRCRRRDRRYPPSLQQTDRRRRPNRTRQKHLPQDAPEPLLGHRLQCFRDTTCGRGAVRVGHCAEPGHRSRTDVSQHGGCSGACAVVTLRLSHVLRIPSG